MVTAQSLCKNSVLMPPHLFYSHHQSCPKPKHPAHAKVGRVGCSEKHLWSRALETPVCEAQELLVNGNTVSTTAGMYPMYHHHPSEPGAILPGGRKNQSKATFTL